MHVFFHKKIATGRTYTDLVVICTRHSVYLRHIAVKWHSVVIGKQLLLFLLLLLLLFFLTHQHKAAGMKIKLSKNNDHDGILLGVKSA